MTLNFSGCHFPQEIIMQALRYYLSYKLSYREIEEIFAERNIRFDHSTLNRWVIKYAPQLEARFRKRKRRVASSWRMALSQRSTNHQLGNASRGGYYFNRPFISV